MFISSAITFRKSLSQGKVVEDTPEASVPLASLWGAVPYRPSFTAVISPQLDAGAHPYCWGGRSLRVGLGRSEEPPAGAKAGWGRVHLSSADGSTHLGLPDLLVFFRGTQRLNFFCETFQFLKYCQQIQSKQ